MALENKIFPHGRQWQPILYSQYPGYSADVLPGYIARASAAMILS